MNASLWAKIKTYAPDIASHFAVLAIGIPAIYIEFANQLPERWVIAGLVAAFAALNLTCHLGFSRWGAWSAHLYLATQTAIVVAALVVEPRFSFFTIWFYVLSIEAMMYFSRSTGYRWIGVFVLVTVAVNLLLFDLTDVLISLPVYLGGFFFFISFANITYQANAARAESQRLLEELQTAHRQLQEYAAQAEQLAAAEERNRLAREMHDTIGHRLTVASVQLEGIQKLISKDPAKAEKMAETVREQVREALRELRQTVATLREPLEADLPLEISLRKLVRSFEEATHLSIHLLLPEAFPEMSAAHRLAIYRTAQEALTNVQKHAEARQVWLQVSRQDGILTLRVSDNGKGLARGDEEAGFGLRGIQERAAQLGGQLQLEERKGGGTQVCLLLPVGGG